MRLRLNVQKYGLPAIRVLWNTECSYGTLDHDKRTDTIATLLDQISTFFHLTDQSLALDDYIVEVEGFGCLPFYTLTEILRDNDEVVVRVIKQNESETRKVFGLGQPSTSERPLVDGPDFGNLIGPNYKIDLEEPLGIHGSGPKQIRQDGPSCFPATGPIRQESFKTKDTNCRAGNLKEKEQNVEDVRYVEHSEHANLEQPTKRRRLNPGSALSKLQPKNLPSSSRPALQGEINLTIDADQESCSSGFITVGDQIPGMVKRNSKSRKVTPSAECRSASLPSQSLLLKIKAPPRQGTRATRKRNERRRTRKQILISKAQGLSAEYATTREDGNWVMANRQDVYDSTQAEGEDPKTLDVRKKILSAALSCEHSERSQSKDAFVSNEFSQPGLEGTAKDSHTSVTHTSFLESNQKLVSTRVESSGLDSKDLVPKDSLPATDPQRRMKLDIPSSKRILFGSLGLRVPRTKQEEEKTRALLMSQKVASNPPHAPAQATTAMDEYMRHNDWSQKLVLTAVECCNEDVVLSVPPFPFVQRWDPKQRASGKKTRLSFQGGKEQEVDGVEEEQSEIRIKDINSTNPELSGSLSLSKFVDQDQGFEAVGNIGERCANSKDSPNAKLEDNSAGPLDKAALSSLRDIPSQIALSTENATPGARIAFKQMFVSEETKWCPQISDFQLAHIESNLGDGQLELTLAYKQAPMSTQKYDPRTGERMYAKFEMPGIDEEEGVRSDNVIMNFSEMIEPLLIR